VAHKSPAEDSTRFDGLVRPLLEPAYRLAAFTLQDGHEAEDAVQEAAIRAWRRLDGLRDDTAIKSWFFTIVANECRSRQRRSWWRVVKTAEPALTADVPDVSAGLDLDRALQRLAPDDRLLIHLRFRLDLPIGEVARALRISEGACRTRLHRVLRGLRPDLEVDEELLR